MEYLSKYSAIFIHIIIAQNDHTINYSTKILIVKSKQTCKNTQFSGHEACSSKTLIHADHNRPERPRRLTHELMTKQTTKQTVSSHPKWFGQKQKLIRQSYQTQHNREYISITTKYILPDICPYSKTQHCSTHNQVTDISQVIHPNKTKNSRQNVKYHSCSKEDSRSSCSLKDVFTFIMHLELSIQIFQFLKFNGKHYQKVNTFNSRQHASHSCTFLMPDKNLHR